MGVKFKPDPDSGVIVRDLGKQAGCHGASPCFPYLTACLEFVAAVRVTALRIIDAPVPRSSRKQTGSGVVIRRDSSLRTRVGPGERVELATPPAGTDKLRSLLVGDFRDRAAQAAEA